MIAVVVVIPVMVVLEAAVRSVPIAGIEAATFMARSDPARAGIGRAGPVATMPDIMTAYWIPIAVDPGVFRPRTYWYDIVARRGRRPNLNADSNLRCGVVSAKQEH